MTLLNVQFQIDDSQLIPGPSAYVIALANGFIGSETEWLESLKAPQGTGGSSQAINIMDFGGTLTGDNTPALNASLAACVTQGKRVIEFPAGYFRFNSQPALINGIRIIGQGTTATYLVREYSGDFLRFGGGTLGAGALENVGILAGAGTTGGSGVLLTVTASDRPDWASLRNVKITADGTGGGTFSNGILLDGSQPVSPQGVRSVRISAVDVFACTQAAINVYNGVAIFMDNVGTYPAAGLTGDVYIGGGAAANLRSTLVCMNNMNIQGALHLLNCSKVTFSGHVIGFNGANTADKCYVTGTKDGGAVTNNTTNSHIALA